MTTVTQSVEAAVAARPEINTPSRGATKPRPDDAMLVMKPKWAKLVVAGERTLEVRTQTNNKYKNSCVWLAQVGDRPSSAS